MRHVVHDDTRRNFIKRSELRVWTEINQRRAEDSESLMVERGAFNHVLAGLPVGVPEGAEPVRERERERDRPIDPAAGVGPIDPAAGVGPIDLDPEEVAIPLTS